jgi:hypothetical protein
MKIISKDNDYYDSVLISSQPIYVRKQEEKLLNELQSDVKKIIELAPSQVDLGNGRIVLTSRVVGFCGRAYPVVKFDFHRYNSDSFSTAGHIEMYAYSKAEVEHMLLHFCRSLKDVASMYSRDKKVRTWMWSVPFNELTVENFFEYRGKKIDDSIFFNIKAPSFLLSRQNRRKNTSTLIVNPVLKEINFQRVMDPFTTAQELEMYLGGVLGNIEKDTVDIDDVHLAAQKGFDKYSFKRPPGKGRPKDPR